MADIKPCPFCGVIPRMGTLRTSEGDYCTLYAEHSYDCYFNTIEGGNGMGRGVSMNHGSLIRKWNRRVRKEAK